MSTSNPCMIRLNVCYPVVYSVIWKTTKPWASVCVSSYLMMCVVSWKHVPPQSTCLNKTFFQIKCHMNWESGANRNRDSLWVSLRWSKRLNGPGVSSDCLLKNCSSFLNFYELVVSLLLWCCRATVGFSVNWLNDGKCRKKKNNLRLS